MVPQIDQPATVENLYFDGLVQKEDLKPTVGQFLRFIEDQTDLCDNDKKALAIRSLKSFAKEEIKSKLKHNWHAIKKYLFDHYKCQLTLKEKIELRRYLIQAEDESISEYHDRCIKAQYMLCNDNADLVLERDIILNFISGVREDIYQIIIRIEPLATLDLCLKHAQEIEQLLKLNDTDKENVTDDKNYISLDNGAKSFISESIKSEDVKVEPKLEDSSISDHGFDEGFGMSETSKMKPLDENEVNVLVLESVDDDHVEISSIDNDVSDSNIESTKEELNILTNKNTTKEHCCTFCSKVYSTDNMLVTHLANTHDQKDSNLEVITCEFCDSKKLNRRSLLDHMRWKHPEQFQICELCPKSRKMGKWKNPLDMALHKNFSHPMMDPNNDKNVLCHDCKESFTISNIKRHIKSAHFDVKLPRCNVCLQYFSTQGKLNAHWKASLCKKEAIFKCEHCDESFKRKRYLHEHGIRAHGNLVVHAYMKLTCEVCGKTITKHFMKKHMHNVHSNQILYCDECGKRFKTEKILEIHKERIHLIKTITCIVEGCDKLFASKNVMNEHIGKMHKVKNDPKTLENKKHMCDQCPKRFSNKMKLLGHKAAIHGGPKPYKCKENDCNYEAAHDATLRNHVKSKHLNIMFECSFPGCGLQKNDKGNMDKHMKFSHGIPLPSERNIRKRINIDATEGDNNISEESPKPKKSNSYYLQRRARN